MTLNQTKIILFFQNFLFVFMFIFDEKLYGTEPKSMTQHHQPLNLVCDKVSIINGDGKRCCDLLLFVLNLCFCLLQIMCDGLNFVMTVFGVWCLMFGW
jgi:hypothetical protein